MGLPGSAGAHFLLPRSSHSGDSCHSWWEFVWTVDLEEDSRFWGVARGSTWVFCQRASAKLETAELGLNWRRCGSREDLSRLQERWSCSCLLKDFGSTIWR